MQIKIKTLTGKVTDSNVEPDETVKDLKVRVTREMRVKGPDANTGSRAKGATVVGVLLDDLGVMGT